MSNKIKNYNDIRFRIRYQTNLINNVLVISNKYVYIHFSLSDFKKLNITYNQLI